MLSAPIVCLGYFWATPDKPWGCLGSSQAPSHGNVTDKGKKSFRLPLALEPKNVRAEVWGDLFNLRLFSFLNFFKLLGHFQALFGPFWSKAQKQEDFFFEKRLLQKSEGNFSERVPVWILVFFVVDFLGLFPFKKSTQKSTQKSTAKCKSEFGSFAAKIHTARTCPWFFSSVFGLWARSSYQKWETASREWQR